MFQGLSNFLQARRLQRSTWVDSHGIRWVRTGLSVSAYLWAEEQTREGRPTAEAYLRQYSHEFPSWAPLWLQYGRSFQAPSQSDCLYRRSQAGLLKMGKCYSNALQTAFWYWDPEKDFSGISYVVGIASNPRRVCQHAWAVINDNSEVVDLTWPDAYLSSYYGVAFSPYWIRDLFRNIGYAGFLNPGIWQKFELAIREKLAQRAVPTN